MIQCVMPNAVTCNTNEDEGKTMMMRPGKHLRNVQHVNWDPTQYLPIDEMIDTKHVASELGVTPRSVQSWQAQGWMPPRQQRGKEMLYRRIDIAKIKAVLTSGIHGDPKG